MADISKINAVALANIAKLDAVTAANIAKVNGLVFSTAPAIGAPAAAYSVRLLDTALGVPTYTGSAMRVREDSGDTETDIGFDTNGDLDTAAIATHCGTANGFVVTWYDQSGNGNDAEQPTAGGAALQPKIYDGTTQAVITENGKPAVTPVGNGDQFELALTGVTAQYAFGVVKTTNTLNSILLTGRTSASIYVLLGVNGATSAPSQSGRVNNYYKNGSSYSPANGDAVNDDTLNQTLYAIDMVGNAISNTMIGYPWANSRCMFITQEIVIWNSDQDSNRTAIEENINTYFSIY